MTTAQDSAREEQKVQLQKHLREMWPLRMPARYENEEQLYADLRLFSQSFWDPPDERYLDVAASTILFSYRTKDFNTTPYPFLFGPKGSGKTRLLDIFNGLCYNPILSPNLSEAAMYQTINSLHPTLLIDETDRLGQKQQDERSQALSQILNAGYRRGQHVIRASREGSDPILYDVFGLKILAGTEPLPDTLADRTIRLDCEKNARDIPLDMDSRVMERLRSQLEMYWSIYSMGKSAEGNPHPRPLDVDPEELKAEIGDNRVTELFYPLYAICSTVEGRKSLLELARETVKERENDETSSDLARVLEAVIRTWQTSAKPPEIAVKDVLAEYNRDLDSKEQITARSMGWRLRKLHLPRVHTDKGSNVKLEARKLCRLARRFTPVLARELSELSETSVGEGKTDNSQFSGQAETSAAREETDNSDVSDVFLGGSFPASNPGLRAAVAETELTVVRRAMTDLEERQGYSPIETLRYRVREQSQGMIDAERLTRIMSVLAKKGELSPYGADCFKLNP